MPARAGFTRPEIIFQLYPESKTGKRSGRKIASLNAEDEFEADRAIINGMRCAQPVLSEKIMFCHAALWNSIGKML